MIAVLKAAYERLLLAEDCRLRCALKRPLSGKLTLKLDESAAIYDPQRTPGFRVSVAAPGRQNVSESTGAQRTLCE